MSESPSSPQATPSDESAVPDPGRRSRGLAPYRTPLVCALLLIAVVCGSHLLGISSRVYAGEPVRTQARSAREAFEQLRASGARGRIVVVLADRSRADEKHDALPLCMWLENPEGRPPVNDANFVTSVAVSGVARVVYIVMPDSEWQRVLAVMANRPDVHVEGSRRRIRLYGVPVVFSRLRDLPSFDEPVVVSVAPGMDGRYDASALERLVSATSADIVVTEKP